MQKRRTRFTSTLTLNSIDPGETSMLDHAGFAVSDYDASKAFYERALAPLGITLLMEPSGKAAGFGRDGRPFFWIEAQGEPVRGRLHIAFRAEDRDSVNRFYAAALQAGATDNGAPGKREIYHPHYYGAYVLDPDGNNIEAVCHQPA
jgi:catechol 2,3-dioxygenase-like lactoylglutathione lyase family enzyme